jgi:hypothetical protein
MSAGDGATSIQYLDNRLQSEPRRLVDSSRIYIYYSFSTPRLWDIQIRLAYLRMSSKSIDNSLCRLIFYLGIKSIFLERGYYKLKNCKVWLRNVVNYGKYSLAKFANFVYFCIACGNCYHIWTENGSNFRTQYKSIQNLKT